MAEIVRADTVDPRNGVDMALHHGRQPLGGAALPEVGLTVTDGLPLDALGAEEIILLCQGLGAARPVEVQADRCLGDEGKVNDPKLVSLAGDHREFTVDKIQVTEPEGQQFSVANLCGKEKDHDGIVAGPILGAVEGSGGIVAPEKHHLFIGENLVIGPGLQLIRDQAGGDGGSLIPTRRPQGGIRGPGEEHVEFL